MEGSDDKLQEYTLATKMKTKQEPWRDHGRVFGESPGGAIWVHKSQAQSVWSLGKDTGGQDSGTSVEATSSRKLFSPLSLSPRGSMGPLTKNHDTALIP